MASREVGVLPPQRRRLLLETAAQEFARSGYERASLNRIIRACGMSKSSFYHYFEAKDALFDAVVTEVGGALVRTINVPDPQELAGPDFWGRIAGIADQLMLLSQSEEWFNDLGRLFYLPDAPTGEGRSLDRARAQVDAWLDRALAAGRLSGAVRDDLPPSLQAQLALAVLQAMDEWSVRHLHEMDAQQRSRLTNTQLDALRRLLAP